MQQINSNSVLKCTEVCSQQRMCSLIYTQKTNKALFDLGFPNFSICWGSELKTVLINLFLMPHVRFVFLELLSSLLCLFRDDELLLTLWYNDVAMLAKLMSMNKVTYKVKKLLLHKIQKNEHICFTFAGSLRLTQPLTQKPSCTELPNTVKITQQNNPIVSPACRQNKKQQFMECRYKSLFILKSNKQTVQRNERNHHLISRLKHIRNSEIYNKIEIICQEILDTQVISFIDICVFFYLLLNSFPNAFYTKKDR